jgi:hypothetical protein
MMHPNRRIAKRMRPVAEDAVVDQEVVIAAVDVVVVEVGDGVASKHTRHVNGTTIIALAAV